MESRKVRCPVMQTTASILPLAAPSQRTALFPPPACPLHAVLTSSHHQLSMLEIFVTHWLKDRKKHNKTIVLLGRGKVGPSDSKKSNLKKSKQGARHQISNSNASGFPPTLRVVDARGQSSHSFHKGSPARKGATGKTVKSSLWEEHNSHKINKDTWEKKRKTRKKNTPWFLIRYTVRLKYTLHYNRNWRLSFSR